MELALANVGREPLSLELVVLLRDIGGCAIGSLTAAFQC